MSDDAGKACAKLVSADTDKFQKHMDRHEVFTRDLARAVLDLYHGKHYSKKPLTLWGRLKKLTLNIRESIADFIYPERHMYD